MRARIHAIAASLAVAVAGATSLPAFAYENGLSAPWSSWRAGAPIAPAPIPRDGIVVTTLPPAVDPGPDGDYADLRVVDGSNVEVPYAIDPGVAPSGPATRDLPLSDTGFVPGAYSQAVADAGDDGLAHDAIAISTSRDTFFVHASVEASDDRRVWRDLAGTTTLYRVAEHGDAGDQTIRFAPTHSRWLRVRIDDAREAFPIDGIAIATADRAPAELARLSASTSTDAGVGDGEERFTLEFGTPDVAVDAVQFDGASGFFSRDVDLETSRDGKQWSSAGSGTIARFARGGAQTGFAVDETRGRYLRVTVRNGNDRPIAGLRPYALTRPRRLVFLARARVTYALAFDDPEVRAPVYDLSQRLAREAWRPVATVAVGTPRIDTTPPPDTRSFLERSPWIVTSAFVLAGIGLALFALQTIRRAP